MVKSQDWDTFWSRESSGRFEQISWSKRRILLHLNPYMSAGQRVMDAGSGSGFFSSCFCSQGLRTYSLDFSAQALAKTNQATSGRAHLFKADFLTDALHSIVPEKMDIIFSDGLFEHFSQLQQTQILRNFVSVLKPGGLVVTFVPNRWSPWQIIRPLWMPGINEVPFTLRQLVQLHASQQLSIEQKGGLNVLPFRLSPEKIGSYFGMLLFVIARNLDI